MSDLSPAGRAMKPILWCLHFIGERHPRLRGHRLIYRVFSSPHSEGLDKLEFINYGYVPLGEEGERLNLEGQQETYRTNIQLYHHVASAAPLQGQEVLEVGCGHGGGTAYVMQSLKPGRMEAIDRSERSIRLCRERYPLKGLTFRTGDALALPYGNEEFDAVLNVESSHAYPCMETFLREVHRVLRPGGHLLFADLRPAKRVPQLRQGHGEVRNEDHQGGRHNGQRTEGEGRIHSPHGGEDDVPDEMVRKLRPFVARGRGFSRV